MNVFTFIAYISNLFPQWFKGFVFQMTIRMLSFAEQKRSAMEAGNATGRLTENWSPFESPVVTYSFQAECL